jgi:hypothetical protein
MTLINSRRILRALIFEKKNPKYKFDIILARTEETDTERVIRKMNRTVFESSKELDDYLAIKGIESIAVRDNRLKLDTSIDGSHLKIGFDDPVIRGQFNLAIITMKVGNNLHVFDMKLIDNEELAVHDGIMLHYMI